ncbi:hypothetical protein, partial [Rhizobium sullae]|uniref:hypothetical protein n=1 Tax=Rhizobium sullae TaxID=50338 RepID=UPI001A9DF075
GARKVAAVTLEIGKNAVAAFGVKPVQLAPKKPFEIHACAPVSRDGFAERTIARQPLHHALPSTAANGPYF